MNAMIKSNLFEMDSYDQSIERSIDQSINQFQLTVATFF